MVGHRVEVATVTTVGQYRIRDLLPWRLAARSAFTIAGVQSVGLDEREGKIIVGFISSSSRSAIEKHLLQLGIPADAISLVAERPVTLLATVRDHNRNKIESGVQFGFRVTAFFQTTCTTGADAIYYPYYGFVTAGHCSTGAANGVNNSTCIYQHDFTGSSCAGAEYVGVEHLDTPYFSCNGGANTCRYSDAMYVRYSSSSFYAGKKVAETSPVGTSAPGGLMIARYRLSAGSSNLTQGLVVRKTGSTTGTTEGSVAQTCVDKLVTGGQINLCQDVVTGYSRGGDSGSPVYWPDGFDFGNLNAAIYHAGILWGGDTLAGQWYVSPWSGITADLGVWY